MPMCACSVSMRTSLPGSSSGSGSWGFSSRSPRIYSTPTRRTRLIASVIVSSAVRSSPTAASVSASIRRLRCTFAILAIITPSVFALVKSVTHACSTYSPVYNTIYTHNVPYRAASWGRPCSRCALAVFHHYAEQYSTMASAGGDSLHHYKPPVSPFKTCCDYAKPKHDTPPGFMHPLCSFHVFPGKPVFLSLGLHNTYYPTLCFSCAL